MEERILDILEEICEDDVIREDKDLDLFEEGLLDSLGVAELLVAVEDQLGKVIAITEIEKEDVNTVNKIIALVESR
ncbi:MAG: D-alanine--poly(phosphoribitol) ligase subunit DltC [Blautia sp.]|nr:D-alanine--poly(phosphoribitol) ligase subunit DltC [Blautia sp.]